MKKLFMKDAYTFNVGGILARIAHRPCTLRVLAGRAWVTSEGDSNDHLLPSCQRLMLNPDQLVVIEADAAGCQIEIACVNNRSLLTFILWCVINGLRQPFYLTPGDVL
ncbi:MAG: DUF2917 domain-containing protein [Glaciimonas sp.]|nr:DUF2917 domain-containing protein [Glaciimonas sp.]